jgi:biotin carboxylase
MDKSIDGFPEPTLLIVGAGVESIPGIKIAKQMGLNVVVSDLNPDAPGFEYADDTIIVSTYDVEGTVAATRMYHESVRTITGVICIASDIPLTVASVAKELGLPGISLDSAYLASDKLAMKEKFSEDNIAIPWFSEIHDYDELSSLMLSSTFPLILKPADSRGARGVVRLTGNINAKWAFDEAINYSSTNRVMVEEFISGPQISTESMIVNGKCFTPGFSDRNYEMLDQYAPYVIENGGDLPSHLIEDEQNSVRKLVEQAAASMGIENGIVKGDIVLDKGKPYVIELAARLSGGYFCTHEIPLNSGVELVREAIKMAIGGTVDEKDLIPKYNRPVSQRYLFPQPGRVVSISGVNEVAGRSSIALCDIRIKVGDVIGSIHNHPARAGVVIARGETQEEAQEEAMKAIHDIQIDTISQ